MDKDKLYEAIKDYIETLDKCNKCGDPTCDSKLQEFNGIYENCYYDSLYEDEDK